VHIRSDGKQRSESIESRCITSRGEFGDEEEATDGEYGTSHQKAENMMKSMITFFHLSF